jgi:membrane-associated PAP2 superfamily phosphatase
MSELSYKPAADIVKAVATFLSIIATAIASFASIATLVAAVGGKSVVNMQGNEVTTSLLFVFASLLLSLSVLGLSCLVLSLLSRLPINESN